MAPRLPVKGESVCVLAHLGRVSARLIAGQQYRATAALLGIEPGGAQAFARLMRRLADGEADQAAFALQEDDAALVRRTGWRLMRGLCNALSVPSKAPLRPCGPRERQLHDGSNQHWRAPPRHAIDARAVLGPQTRAWIGESAMLPDLRWPARRQRQSASPSCLQPRNGYSIRSRGFRFFDLWIAMAHGRDA